mgnify:CR=1 FL=1
MKEAFTLKRSCKGLTAIAAYAHLENCCFANLTAVLLLKKKMRPARLVFVRSVLRISTLGVALDDEVLPRGKRFADFLAVLATAAERGCRDAVIEANVDCKRFTVIATRYAR